MTRILINLDPEDKAWLDRESRARNVPMTELVRQAVRAYRVREESLNRPKLQAALAQTAGILSGNNGLAFQSRLRDEWEQRILYRP